MASILKNPGPQVFPSLTDIINCGGGVPGCFLQWCLVGAEYFDIMHAIHGNKQMMGLNRLTARWKMLLGGGRRYICSHGWSLQIPCSTCDLASEYRRCEGSLWFNESERQYLKTST